MESNKIKNNSIVEEQVICNVIEFLKQNKNAIEEQYYSVIDKETQRMGKNSQIYEDIELSSYNAELLKVSVVILTANPFESEILNYNVFKDNNVKIKRLKDGINIFKDYNFQMVDAYIMTINGYTVLHLHSPETGSNTPCGSSDLVRYACNNKYLYPSCIISFGICYGIDPKNYCLGDTIIANKVYPWSVGIKIDDERWQIKHDDYILNLRGEYPKLYYNIQNVISGKQNRRTDISFGKVEMGNMLTGEAVVSNEKIKIEAIQNAYGCKIIGGEMEGYGLAKECIYYSKIPCLILKAICDWGVCKNIDAYLPSDLSKTMKVDCKGKIQAYSTYCAYVVLRKLFYENIFQNESICEEITEDIYNNYYINGYIQDEYLRKHIVDFFVNKFRGDSNNLMIYNINDIVELLISDYLISTEKLKRRENEGIVGYIFM